MRLINKKGLKKDTPLDYHNCEHFYILTINYYRQIIIIIIPYTYERESVAYLTVVEGLYMDAQVHSFSRLLPMIRLNLCSNVRESEFNPPLAKTAMSRT